MILILLSPLVSSINVKAYSDHPNLFVSAENSLFENHFAGAMVVEVIVIESDTSLDHPHGEPNVTINGKQLRMAQGSDGFWYAFFANTQKAQQTDQIAFAGTKGQSLDFGVFCDRSTSASVLGADFSQTDGVAIPDSNGLTSGATQGTAAFTPCVGTLNPPSINQDNVVRHPPSLNTNPNVPSGQIGLNPNAWPIIQLFTFSETVHIEYDRSGGTQSVDLGYSDIPNISVKLDRAQYPQGSEVFATINDIQLSEDPTSINSWTFSLSPQATFYQAFTESGANAGNGGTGLVNLFPNLSTLGFNNNGYLKMNLGSVATLKSNQFQPSTSVTDGTVSYNQIVTFVETAPHSGIFTTSDYGGKSTIGILSNAARFQSGSITYSLQSASILSATFNANISVNPPASTPSVTTGTQINPGQKFTITLVDPTQNLNAAVAEHLDVFRSSAIIPTIKIGNPVTLQSASNVQFYATSSAPLTGGTTVPSSVPDINSNRLVIDTTHTSNGQFAKITINLGITAYSLQNLFVNTRQPNTAGTNWINYDFRSFQQQLGIKSFSDTSMTLHFGDLTGTNLVQILPPGGISSGNGLVQISNTNIVAIDSEPSSSQVFLEINFDSSGNPSNTGTISNPVDTQPVVFDLFSFGNKNGQTANNAVYRAELEETSNNSGVFTGTLEYVVANQLNQFDPSLIQSLHTFSNQIRFLVIDQLIDEKAMNLAYSNIANSGAKIGISSSSNIQGHTGTVTLDSQNYHLGQSVIVTLNDPDLSTDSSTVQSYPVINDPNSPADDTVGDSNGNILLEILIKGFRYQHCTINGIQYGGLGSTGFALVETSPGSGIFKGSFKMPSQICSEDGTQLISPIGGNVVARYHDFMDALGRSVIIDSTTPQLEMQPAPQPTFTQPPAIPTLSKMPDWVRNIFMWYDKGQISEDDLLTAIKFLANQGIVKLD